MAGEDLSLRMRLQGARRAARDVEQVGDELRGLRRDARRGADSISVFTRALTIMQTRAVIATFVIVGLGVAIGSVTPAVVLLAGALTSLGALMLPVFALGVGAVQMFGEQAGIAGTAAYELATVLADLRHAWALMIGPGATILLGALADGLRTLMPLLGQLEGPMTLFATALADAIGIAAAQLATLGPDLARLLSLMGPLLVIIAGAVGPFTGALIDAATYGLPVLEQLALWLRAFALWLRPTLADLNRFAHSAQAAAIVAGVFAVVAAAAEYVAGVVSSLAQITYGLYVAIEPLLPALGVVLLTALHAVAGALGFVAANIGTIAPLVVGLTAALLAGVAAWRAYMIVQTVLTLVHLARGLFIAWRAGVLAMTAAQMGLNVALLANPIGLVVAAIAALVAGLVYAYTQSEWFRGVIDGLWQTIKDAASFIATGAVLAWQLYTDYIGTVITAVQTLVGWLGDAWDLMRDVAGFAMPGGDTGLFSGNGVLGIAGVPGLASGGTVRAAGTTLVGERGPELLHLPAGASVEPLSERSDTIEVVLHHTTTLDRRVLAQEVYRESIRKNSTS